MTDPPITPRQARDALDRVQLLLARRKATRAQVDVALLSTAIAARRFTEALQDFEARDFWAHPDVLEADVAAEAWYPGETDHA